MTPVMGSNWPGSVQGASNGISGAEDGRAQRIRGMRVMA